MHTFSLRDRHHGGLRSGVSSREAQVGSCGLSRSGGDDDEDGRRSWDFTLLITPHVRKDGAIGEDD